MSYIEIKPQYYRMHQPDSPWHAGSPGWSTAPWPTFQPNLNLVGPPRLGVGAFEPSTANALYVLIATGVVVGLCAVFAK